MESSLQTLLQRQRVLVCCGSGGVGKTTCSAALALSAARLGRRTLVLTIDPSRRLAETLSIARNAPAPTALMTEELHSAGLREGKLSAWVLDPKQVSDRVVRERGGPTAEALLGNRIYRGVSSMIAGMQEYTAVEALHRFLDGDDYDLIILDTPPSRHAIRFLDAPKRVQRFLDKRIFQLFLPRRGLLGRVADRVIDEVLERSFGAEVSKDLRIFFSHFTPILEHLEANQEEMERFFKSPSLSFLLITTPSATLLPEVRFFEQETRERRDLRLGGFLLNRCPAPASTLPQELQLKIAESGLREGIGELRKELTQRRALVHQLSQELQGRAPLYHLPELGESASQLEGIIRLSDLILES